MKQMIKEILEDSGYNKLSRKGKFTCAYWTFSMMGLTLYINAWIMALCVLNFLIASILLINITRSNETSND